MMMTFSCTVLQKGVTEMDRFREDINRFFFFLLSPDERSRATFIKCPKIQCLLSPVKYRCPSFITAIKGC